MAASASMAMPTTTAAGLRGGLGREVLFGLLQKGQAFGATQMKKKPINYRLQVKASFKEKAITTATAAALTASMMVPEMAEAAEISPSLKNFLLSILAGGVVLAAIGGAVIAVSYFDPVKRT